MWTYRPADSSTPIQQKNGPRAATAHTEPIDRLSAAASHERRSSVQQPAAFIRAQQQRAALDESLLREEKARAKGFGLSVTARPGHAQVRPARMIRTACVLGGLYLAGLAAGSLSSRFLSEPLLTYARYFASIDLNLRTTGNAAMVFSVSFLSLFCQLTLILIAGFCVLGLGLIPITLVLKGAGAGVFTALLYQQLGPAKGLLLQALVFWLPETLGSLFVLMLSSSALHLSCSLLQCCLGQTRSGLGGASRRLIHRYLTICFVSMLICGLSVLLTLVFGSLF